MPEPNWQAFRGAGWAGLEGMSVCGKHDASAEDLLFHSLWCAAVSSAAQ